MALPPRRDQLPATKPIPATSEKTPPVRNPALNATLNPALNPAHEGARSFVTDHSSRPGGHELDHSLRPGHEQDHHTAARPHLALGAAGLGRVPLGRGERDRHFFSSDENALTKQIQATHAPEYEDLDVKPVLAIVEDIMRLAKPSASDLTTHDSTTHGAPIPPAHAPLEKLDHDKALQTPYHHDDDRVYYTIDHDSEIIKILAYPINKISCEIICKCSGGAESHSATMDLLKTLSSYSWDAKVVITFAAFAISYGEFWLVEQNHTKIPLAKNIATLKDLPETLAQAAELKKKFEAVLNLLNAVLKVTHCIIEFNELPPMYISKEAPEITAATAHIPTAVYWIIRALLVCATTLLSLIGSSHEQMTLTSESWEILSLAHKLSVIMEHLQNQLKICKDLIGRKKLEDAYIAFKRLMESAHIDNMKVLKAMFRSREEPLYNGSTTRKERLETLRLKYVLLLISDLEVPHEELNVLHMIYNQDHTRRHEYEVLWLPVVDPTTALTPLQEATFYNLRDTNMPWLSVDHPSLVEPVAIRYIREEWRFVHMPMLVVLDPHGKPSNLDALPMMWIWGGAAFPFTKDTERSLWRESTWNIRLLADSIDPRIDEWIRDNKVICLYGGEDIDWINRFTHLARDAARSLGVPLEMLYVGKRNPKDKVRRCHEFIDANKLSHVFSVKDYYDYVWYFWVRLWSMWNSKKQIGRTIDDDQIMTEIMDVLTLDSSEKGWAVFSRGNYEITKGNGDRVVPVLENYSKWGYLVDHPDRFVPVLDEQLRGMHPEHHCNRLILPGQAGYIPERVVCSECGKTMEKFVMYRCCTD